MRNSPATIVAHRGLTENGLVENTLESLVAAVDAGISAVEFDVRRTADGEWIVHHDASLARIYDADCVIRETTLREAQRLAPVLTLDSALDLFGGGNTCLPLVEVKEPDSLAAPQLLEVLTRHARRTPLVVIARGHEMPEYLLNANASLAVMLYTRDWNEARDRSANGFSGFDLPHDSDDLELVARCMNQFEKQCQKVAVWTVNDVDAAWRWQELGAEWIITDRPLLLARALDE